MSIFIKVVCFGFCFAGSCLEVLCIMFSYWSYVLLCFGVSLPLDWSRWQWCAAGMVTPQVSPSYSPVFYTFFHTTIVSVSQEELTCNWFTTTLSIYICNPHSEPVAGKFCSCLSGPDISCDERDRQVVVYNSWCGRKTPVNFPPSISAIITISISLLTL